MFEKVNPAHPDKIADRIAGAIVDYAYGQQENPKIAVEVMIGHGKCFVISETSVHIPHSFVLTTAERLTGKILDVVYIENEQDEKLAHNQTQGLRCGDNGIFRGTPTTKEQEFLSGIAWDLYGRYGTDGKYLIKDGKLTICQSNASTEHVKRTYPDATVNPLGDWTGGIDVDTGATNRKLGSDMGDAMTGGGLHGKDLSKADVSINIYAHLLAERQGRPVEISCSIGDEIIDGKKYEEIVEEARAYIKMIGGFEKFAEWGLI